MTKPWPDQFDFEGMNAPSRIECDIYDLVVTEGEVPEEIHGTWFRSIPDPQYPPMLGHDTYLSGDGMVGAFRFEDGHVDYAQKYVKTERLLAERRARRSLHGLYRNPYTDDPSVRWKVDRGAANTTPIWHGGRLLATKEDSLPYEVDPFTLDTVGRFSYEGKWRSKTHTAHSRIDFDTGEMFIFGYQADGLASPKVAFGVVDPHGDLVSEEWFETPYPSWMHDFAVTKEHVLFPVFSATTNIDRIKAGQPHWIYDLDLEPYVGIMPRGGSVSEMRWFKFPEARSAFHFMNAYTDGDRVHLDFGCGKYNPFPFCREASGLDIPPQELGGSLVRWTFNMANGGDTIDEHRLAPGGDFPLVADVDHMKDYEIGYYEAFDPEVGPPLIAGPVGAGFNSVRRLEVKTGGIKKWDSGPTTTLQEPVHIPSHQAGHEGYLAMVVDRHDHHTSDVVLLEAEHLDRGPIARINVPFRLRNQVHGTWVRHESLELEAKQRPPSEW
jgi:carotenoid cleavage dioxygenase-like enzyme